MWVAHGEGIAHMGGIPNSMSEGLDQVLADTCSSIPFRKCQPEGYLLPGRNPSGVEIMSFTNLGVPIKEASQRSCVGRALVEQWQRQPAGGRVMIAVLRG